MSASTTRVTGARKHLAGVLGVLFILALCVMYQWKDWRKLLVLVTAFTIGHSITLALSVLQVIRIPSAWIEFLIPVTIVITALSNVGRRSQPAANLQLNYFFALFFGLIHGLGFSNYLKSMLGSQANIVEPLLAFNLGLEFGQLLIVSVYLLLSLVIAWSKTIPRPDLILFVSAAIFGVAFIICLERMWILIHP